MKPIRHVNELGTRVREQGRLRMGVKTGNAMKAIKHWRFTSPEKEPLMQLAVLYGGEVRPWSDSKAGQGANQFELLSSSEKIRVFVPPGGLSTWYEEWAGGGIRRRCDGETVFIDGDDQNTSSCICSAKDVMVCKPKTRLSVVLPEITPFGGVWRLDTGSWNAADEMASMEKMLDQLQVSGLVEAQLLIEERQKMVKGRKSKFVVPVILVSASAQQALDAVGGGNTTALMAAPETLVLGTGEPVQIQQTDTQPASEDVVEAQIVDMPGYDRPEMDARFDTAFALLIDRYDWPPQDMMAALARGGSGGNTIEIDALSDSQHNKVVLMTEALAQGRKLIANLTDGRLIIK